MPAPGPANSTAWHYGDSGVGWVEGDFNADTDVNVSDLGILAGNYGATTGPAGASVPEPATVALLAMAALALPRRRRR